MTLFEVIIFSVFILIIYILFFILVIENVPFVEITQ